MELLEVEIPPPVPSTLNSGLSGLAFPLCLQQSSRTKADKKYVTCSVGAEDTPLNKLENNINVKFNEEYLKQLFNSI